MEASVSSSSLRQVLELGLFGVAIAYSVTCQATIVGADEDLAASTTGQSANEVGRVPTTPVTDLSEVRSPLLESLQ
jgi:hypothetical protein